MTAEFTARGRDGVDELEGIGRRLIVDGYLKGDSVLTPGAAVWSSDNFAELKRIYIDRPDQSPDKGFFDKLRVRFDDASDGAIQLFAELLLLNVLPLANYLGKTKVNRVEQVLDMMASPVPVPDEIVRAAQIGAFNGGTAFGVRRWSQIWLLIFFGLHLHALSDERRARIAEDPLEFRDALAEVARPNEPAQRAALCYLAFPKFFLPLVNGKDRKLIRDTFASYLDRPVSPDVEVDLHDINRAFEAEQNRPIDYYRDPWVSMWRPAKAAKNDAVDPETVDDVDVSLLDADLPDPGQELADQLHVDLGWLAKCVTLLRDRPQLIFYGPPGTGKTYVAKALARHLADGADNVKIVQFHPAYSYEDFFEGFRPLPAGNGQVGFELKPGPLRVLVERARGHPDQVFVLIIDEINRGNLAKIFGELYFLLEYRDEAIDLMYSSQDTEPFTLPRNLLMIGTMNTADRSIALVDAAMRRRFGFLPLHPALAPTNQMLRRWLHARNYPSKVADLHDALNARIPDPNFQIGPSYFMRPAVHNAGGLSQVWETSILPLLEEYHFGDRTVDVEATYGLAVLEKIASGGESP
ncbi:McrB family protein [Rhodococcus koreensis]|uniref:McrB family protein n=1 Tax=Rhodococcus koreensis TaxID=99653 RepID=UPI00197DEC58|nr:AAA family ATPase [Rhodococcus koreensis]QSE84860.1 AAA family ATPase [Rhodococcus koreensis]